MAFPTAITPRSYGGDSFPTYLTTTIPASYSANQTFTINSASTWFEINQSGQITGNSLGTSGAFVVTLDYASTTEEKVLCSGISGNVITVWTDGINNGRGYDGTSIQAHSIGSSSNPNVFPVLTATEMAQLNAQTISSATAITALQTPAYGNFSDTTTQTNAGVTSSNLITLNTTNTSRNVSVVSGSKITFAKAGTYSVSLLGQFAFTGGASNYNITVWYAINGSAIANSSFSFTTTSAQNSNVLATVQDIIAFNAGDYIQFYWWSGASGMALTYVGAGTSPTRPASPSVNFHATQLF